MSKIADWFPFVDKSSLLAYLEPKGTDRTHIHRDFLQAVNKDCKFYVVAEGRKSNIFVANKWIVRENSASFPGPHEFVMHKNADHTTVCKPQNRNDTGYLKLIKCIDQVIKEYKGRITVDLSVTDPIGIEGKIDEVCKLLERPKVSIVGLFGMGGAGKTTLSKAFYNFKAYKYAKSCYLENVKSKRVHDAQKELLRGLCGIRLDEHEHVGKQHLDMIKDCFLMQKVLVVVDDVSSEDYLRDLQVFHALEIGSQNHQSKVVVIGRDSSVLPRKYLKSGKVVIELVNGITKGSDLELFLRYALDAVDVDVKEKIKTESLEEAERIVQLCNGLPLSLEVLGKYLGNSVDEDGNLQQWKETWVEAYERLQKAQSITGDRSEKLWISLRMSYDDLGDLEKKMFLDFACTFSEMKVGKGLVERIWGSPIGVQKLMRKSLLKVEGGYFVMHEQLRDMGRYVLLKEALEVSKHPIYLWQGYPYHVKTYMDFKKLTTESGVPYFASLEREVETSSHQYSKLRLLSVSEFDTSTLVDACLSQCSGDLRWLNLLNYSGVLKTGFQKLCSFGGLRVLHILGCGNLVELPKAIDKLINLVEMEVRFCGNLESLPDSIGKLTTLKSLVIGHCAQLRVVPYIGKLSELEYLSFETCYQLSAIEGTQICTQKLQELNLPIVPTTSCLSVCPQLRSLRVKSGEGVQEFPQDFFKIDMPKLEVVWWWSGPGREVVLKNPDGSQLVLQCKSDIGVKRLEVHRQHDGSISQLTPVEGI